MLLGAEQPREVLGGIDFCQGRLVRTDPATDASSPTGVYARSDIASGDQAGG